MRPPTGNALRRSKVPAFAIESLEDRRLLSLPTLSSGPDRGLVGVAIAAEVAPPTVSPTIALQTIAVPPGPEGSPSVVHGMIAIAPVLGASSALRVIGSVV